MDGATEPHCERPAPGWPLPFWIAHRGAGRRAPENTLAAFRVGASHGYRAFECDVKLSADGIAFLLHDATLERTTSGSGPAAALRWEDLSRLDAGGWLDPAYAGEPPASLAAIAAFCRAGGHALNIEIKPSPGLDRPTGAAVGEAVRTLWPAGAAVVFSSFSESALEGAREAAPEIPRALLRERLDGDWLGLARGLGCAAVVAHHRVLDMPAIASIHAAGLRAAAYTVNERADAERLQAAGIDGLITDAVDVFTPR